MKRISGVVKKKFETIVKQYDKHDKIVMVTLLGMIILLLILSPFLPDNGPKIIKDKLSNQGYDVESFMFEKTDERLKRIYKASEPLDIGDGTYVEYWEIVDMSLSPTGIPRYAVKPFPEIVIPTKFPINFEISEQEYESLKEITNGEPVEEFIKRLLLQYIQDEKGGI